MKPQDVVVAIALMSPNLADKRYATIAQHVGIVASEAHTAVGRLQVAGLVNAERVVLRRQLGEFLLHGFKYVFPVAPSGPALGVPTGAAAPMLARELPKTDEPWVWPSPKGTVRGLEIKPLYPTVPEFALRDLYAYELLALLDALRAGGVREKSIAAKRIAAAFEGA